MDLSFLNDLNIPVFPDALLSTYTTFKLGGPCKALIKCVNAKQAVTTVLALRTRQIPFIIIGFGSNILVSDDGVDTVIIRYSSGSPLITRMKNTLAVDAATQFDALAQYAVNAGLDGMTSFSGIPGTVGGALAGNAGAYGKQICDNLVSVNVLNPDSTISTLQRNNIKFEYRDSDLKHNGAIILSATFALNPGDASIMRTKRTEIIHIRESKHGRWQETSCAGSFFKNVEPTSSAGPRQSAGWFIEQSGAHTLNIGGAHSYSKHANIITRNDGATSRDVYTLTRQIVSKVKEKFDIELVREVRLLGMFDGTGNAENFW